MATDRDHWTPPTAPERHNARRVPGAMGGSLLLDQPRYAAQRARIEAFVAPGPKLAVEVGFDHGINLLANARMFVRWHWLGVELRRRRVDAVAPHAPANCLAARLDARTLFAVLLPPQRVDRVDILFPTPTTNARHLLLTPFFAADIARAIAPSGVLHLLTDVAAIAALFDTLFADWRPCPPLPRAPDLSRRERICRRDGVAVHERAVFLTDGKARSACAALG